MNLLNLFEILALDDQAISTAGTFTSYFIALAIPLIFVAMGGMFSEHSGIVNIALEGIMVFSAMVGCILMKYLDLPVSQGLPAQLAMFISVFGAGLAGALFASLLSFAANRFRADQTIAGTALNIIAPALYIIVVWAINKGQTQLEFPTWYKMSMSDFGITDANLVPLFWRKLFFTKLSIITTFFALVLFPLAAFVLYRTKFGLRLRSCGEHPEAAASLGLNVYGIRYAGVAISGFLGGIGAMSYVLVVASSFDGQVAGYGFLALAVMIFGNWKPGAIILAGLFFSLFRTMSSMNSLISWLPTFSNIKGGSTLYLLLPYVVTLIVLIFASKHSQAPKAEGVPFDVEKRS